MTVYWNTWKEELLDLSGSQSTLSVDIRDIADNNLALM